MFYKCFFSAQPSPTQLGRLCLCFEQLRQLLQLDHLAEFLDVENKIFSPLLLHVLSFFFFSCQATDLLCPVPGSWAGLRKKTIRLSLSGHLIFFAGPRTSELIEQLSGYSMTPMPKEAVGLDRNLLRSAKMLITTNLLPLQNANLFLFHL